MCPAVVSGIAFGGTRHNSQKSLLARSCFLLDSKVVDGITSVKWLRERPHKRTNRTLTFTYCSKLSHRTNAFKAIDFVFTGSAITARGRVAVVDVDFTNWSCEAACTRAKKPAVSVYARTSIMTRVGCTVVLTWNENYRHISIGTHRIKRLLI